MPTTKNSQTKPNTALLAVFSSSARVIVLRLFMLDPLRAYYQRQIESATGLPIRAVQREVDRLASSGLLYRRTEGNRVYYQVDMQCPLFPEFRGLFLKTASDEERARGLLALDESVRLAFLNPQENKLLVVTSSGRPPAVSLPGYSIEVMSVDEFLRLTAERASSLDLYLVDGVDLLGRREDVIWRRIEAAGYEVRKGQGVP